MMQTQTDQGVAVRTARLARRLTREQLATMSGIAESDVRRAEAGARLPDKETAALCVSLGLDAGTLVAEPDRPDDESQRVRIRRLADKNRLMALVIAFDASLVATLAWPVLDRGSAVQVAALVAVVALVGFGMAVVAYALLRTAPAVPGGIRGKLTAGEIMSAARDALGGAQGALFAVRLLCVPPAIMALLYVLREALPNPTLPMLAAGMVLGLITGRIVSDTTSDVSRMLADQRV